MNLKELMNIQNEFNLLSNELLESTEETFSANLKSFKEFCDSTEIIHNILTPISQVKFDGIEYFCKQIDPGNRFKKFPKPNNRNEMLKVSYDVLWDNDIKSNHIWNYAVWIKNPGTNVINELLSIGNTEISGRLIKFIDLELEKLINNEKELNEKSQINFTVQNAIGSIIGTQSSATINNGLSFDEIEKYIRNKEINSDDKEKLLELNNYVKTLAENNVPLSKGILNRFSDIIAKHSWVPSLIGSALIKHFIG